MSCQSYFLEKLKRIRKSRPAFEKTIQAPNGVVSHLETDFQDGNDAFMGQNVYEEPEVLVDRDVQDGDDGEGEEDIDLGDDSEEEDVSTLFHFHKFFIRIWFL